MADFSFLSDTDDSAIEEVISQAQDLCVLEQVSAINCSGFTDSVLPNDLDTRFRKLKSFPLTKPKLNASVSSPYLSSAHPKSHFNLNNESKSSVRGKPETDSSLSDEEIAIFSPSKQNSDEKKGLKQNSGSGFVSSRSVSEENPGEKTDSKPKSKSGSVSSPLNSSNFEMENEVFLASEQNPDVKKKGFKQKSRHGSFHSPSGSSNLSMDSRSPSPPRKTGCFWCSPKKNSRKNNYENQNVDIGLDWGKNDELILSDSNIFSSKEQKRKLKEAMREEEKISREAEKIIKWAKQASARMNISSIEDELSDDDSFK